MYEVICRIIVIFCPTESYQFYPKLKRRKFKIIKYSVFGSKKKSFSKYAYFIDFSFGKMSWFDINLYLKCSTSFALQISM